MPNPKALLTCRELAGESVGFAKTSFNIAAVINVRFLRYFTWRSRGGGVSKCGRFQNTPSVAPRKFPIFPPVNLQDHREKVCACIKFGDCVPEKRRTARVGSLSEVDHDRALESGFSVFSYAPQETNAKKRGI